MMAIKTHVIGIAQNAVCAAAAAFVAIPVMVSAAAGAFALTVAAMVAALRPLRAIAIAAKRDAIAAASALDIMTSPAAICVASWSIGRFRAARSCVVPTIAGMAAFL